MKENQQKPPEGGRVTRESLPKRLPLYLYKQTKDFFERNVDLRTSNGHRPVSEEDVYNDYLSAQDLRPSSLIFRLREFEQSELYKICLDIMRTENPNRGEIRKIDVYGFFSDHIRETHRARNQRPTDLVRDDEPRNHVPLLEPEPLAEPDAKERLALENIDRRRLAAYVVQLEETDPAFVAELEAARTARHAFSEAASAADASQPVPDKAPRLWSERDKRTEKHPAEFIRSTYAFCMANLGQHHLLTLDRGLYRRYVDWKDEPKELVNGKIRPCDQPVEFGSTTRLSDEERGRRAREQSNATKAKKRAQQKASCDNLPHVDP